MKITLVAAFILMAGAAQANPVPFFKWVEDVKTEAKAAGVSDSVIQRAFDRLEPNERVIELDRQQPESTKTFTQYIKGSVTQQRIDQGRRLLAEHRVLLDKISAQYGVQPQMIVALWGTETSYGGYTGNMSIIRSLATLAYDGRRSDYFRDELIKALRIVDEGHVKLDDFTGSWAGAMGQCQFMPSSFFDYAVDYNGDGRKDIWNSLPDVFASIANYLSESGWDTSQTWGRKVKLPADFDMNLGDGKQWKPISEWQALGVRNNDGGNLPANAMDAAITLPGKPHEQAYMVYRNYDVILKWNRSRYFATAVGTLADYIAMKPQ